jgi:Leucine-rich repeat (LRR) protein
MLRGIISAFCTSVSSVLFITGLRAAKALVVLKVSNNQLKQLPGELLEGWGSLTELDLSKNLLQVKLTFKAAI